MTIKHWPATERPREKLLDNGAKTLSDAELLAIIVGSGVRGEDALTTARKALEKAGGLSALCRLPVSEFTRIAGLGPRAFSILNAASEIFRRSLLPSPDEPLTVDSRTVAERLFAAELTHLGHEAFACLFLDTRHRFLGFDILATGTLDRAQIYPREVVKRVLDIGAAAVIFGHNHPSGVAEPSAADSALTASLQAALRLIDVRILDHIIVAPGACASMADLGLLN